MHEALEQLRAELDRERVDFAELVVLGARAKTQQLRANGPRAREARTRLASMIRGRSLPVDAAAADDVKQRGLLRRDASSGVLHYDRDYDALRDRTSLSFESAWLAPAGTL